MTGGSWATLPIQLVPVDLSPRLTEWGHEADHRHPALLQVTEQ